MKFRVGACALLVCLAGCSSEGTNTKFGDLMGSAATNSPGNKQPLHVQGRDSKSSIANAPDRGALVSYENKGAPSKQEGAYTWFPVAISEEHALRAVATGEMTVPSPDGSQVKLRYERHVEHPDGNWTWVGRVEGGDQQQEAILTFGENAVYGSIPQATGAPALSLQTRGGSLWAVVTDPTKVVSPNKGTDIMVPPAMALRASLASSVSKAQVMQGAVAAGAPATAANTIDLAVGYTQGFAAVYGGQSAAVTRLVFLVEVGNQAFTNSLINGYLRIVSAVQVDYADNTTNEAALGQLTGNNGTSAVTIPAALVPLRTARDQYGADLAVLVRKFQTPENDGCGIAWLNGANQTAINPAVDDDFGFAVISDGNDIGTDGKSYFCAQETLVHELAHLMGSAHDRDNSKNAQGGLQYGRYPYSFGMKTDSANGNFYTIMAYGDDNQNFYRTFSNPLVARCGSTGNLLCGVANQTDNARSLNQTIPVVATFRSTVVPIVGKIPRDFNGDGRSDIFWRNSLNGQNVIWNGANRATSGFTDTVADQNWKAVASGDFSGDGRADIFWRNSATGQNILWPNGSGGQLRTLSTVSDLGWKVVGAGDFNGDGRTDLFWRHSSNGQNLIWWAGESTTTEARTTVATAWRVAGIGDFDGDGKEDIFWRNTSTGENLIWPSASIANAVSQTAITSQVWQIAAVGDFNADGMADVFWKNSATGQTVLWPAGNYAGSAYGATVAANWQVLSSGDYNGDGRIDLFWYNSVTGGSIVWWSAGPANAVATEPVFTEWAPAF